MQIKWRFFFIYFICIYFSYSNVLHINTSTYKIKSKTTNARSTMCRINIKWIWKRITSLSVMLIRIKGLTDVTGRYSEVLHVLFTQLSVVLTVWFSFFMRTVGVLRSRANLSEEYDRFNLTKLFLRYSFPKFIIFNIF